MSPKFLVVDLFCGAGGTTTGFTMAGGVAKVIACVNHDAKAIQSHWENHPEVFHFNEDIRTLHLEPLRLLCERQQEKYPDALLILWASLECTNFSKAKGGQPRDADSRTLADHLDRYVQALQPDYIQIENVVEFMCWGPLDENGKPISRKNGQDFMRWRNMMCAHGYRDEWQEMNSANYGAYTSRNRLFGVFARPELPIVWPEPTHAKNPVKHSMMGESLKQWKAVKEVLDFSDEGKSIFDRQNPLVEKTLERIYAGLIKEVAGGKEAFMLKYNSTDKNGKHCPPSLDEPSPVVATQNRLGVVNVGFISKYYSGRPEGKNIGVEGPAGTITTCDHQALVQANFLINYYGSGGQISDTNLPCGVIPTRARQALATANFIMRDYSGGGQHSSIDNPCGALLAVPKANLVSCQHPFLMHTNYNNLPTSVDETHPVITANRKWSYLVNPSWGGNPSGTDKPCPVVVARQDKAPLYLVVSEQGDVAIRIDETDSECMRKIKEFMVLYGIIDIKMRMLRVDELLRIQGFPEGYELCGTQADKKKFIGNSVVPQVVKAWVEAMAARIDDVNKKVA